MDSASSNGRNKPPSEQLQLPLNDIPYLLRGHLIQFGLKLLYSREGSSPLTTQVWWVQARLIDELRHALGDMIAASMIRDALLSEATQDEKSQELWIKTNNGETRHYYFKVEYNYLSNVLNIVFTEVRSRWDDL